MSGSKWYKCDFHLHSGKSKCFIENEDLDIWVDKVVESGLDCVALTNHNSPGDIDRLKTKLESKGKVFFPGVEITCSDSKVHLLIIFDCRKNESHVRDFLITSGIKSESFGEEDAYTSKSISEIAAIASEYEGIVVGAHIDQYSSLKNVKSLLSIQEFLGLENVVGVQITKPLHILKEEGDKDIIRILDQVELKKKSFLTFSDNPSEENPLKHGISGIGSSFTHIKMSENPTISSLKQALLMSEVRVVNKFEQTKQPATPEVFISKLQIENANGFDEVNLSLNTGFNTLIGGRGAGKSSILRILRLVLQKGDEISKFNEIKSDYESFFDEKNGPMGPEANIHCFLVNGSNKYKIKISNIRKYDKYDYDCKRINGDDEDIIEKHVFIDILNSLNIEIFSQKQLYALSSDPEQIIGLIDRKNDQIRELKNNAEEIKEELKKAIYSFHKINGEASVVHVAEESLVTVSEKLTKINSEINGDIHEFLKSKSDIAVNNEVYINSFNNFKRIRNEIKSLCGTLEEVEDAYSSTEDEFVQNWLSENKTLLNELNDSLRKYTENNRENLQKLFSSAFWKTKKINNSDYLKIKARSSDINETLKQKEKYEKVIVNKETISARREEAKKRIAEEYKRLLEIHSEIRTLREGIITNYIPKEALLKISLVPHRNISRFIEELCYRSSISENTFLNDKEKLSTFFNNGPDVTSKISEFIEMLKNDDLNGLDLDSRFIKKIKDNVEHDSYELLLILPLDAFKIKYINKVTKEELDLSKGSHGQRTSAILSILLHLNNSLIIIDQPEDDLDNKLIYGLIVKNILNNKNSKQMLMVTHNPNIPVNGDSDLIISMGSNSKNISLQKAGELDDHEIMNNVCDIMEGGQEAFRSRASKYGF